MFDMQALASARREVGQRDTQQQAQAEAIFQEGMALLEAYHLAPSKDKLKAFMLMMLRSLQHKRSLLEPHLMLAQVYYALDKPSMAVHYLQRAQALAPRDQRVESLREAFSSHQAPELIQPAESAATAPQSGFEALYDEVEDLQQSELRDFLASLRLPPAPSEEPRIRAQVQRQAHELGFWIQDLALKVELIDREFDASDLQHYLQGLRQRHDELLRFLQTCQEFATIRQRLDQAFSELAVASRELQQSALDQLFDTCDFIADRLDEQEARQVDASHLVALYRRLIAEVETLQDRLDD